MIGEFLSNLEFGCHKLFNAHGFTLVTPNICGWEAFSTPRALTLTKITWALSPRVQQVPSIIPGSPLCLWCCQHPHGEAHNTNGHQRIRLHNHQYNGFLILCTIFSLNQPTILYICNLEIFSTLHALSSQPSHRSTTNSICTSIPILSDLLPQPTHHMSSLATTKTHL